VNRPWHTGGLLLKKKEKEKKKKKKKVSGIRMRGPIAALPHTPS
jgi:hypothetical protein